MRFAVISDVHGNVHALDAVLADIERQRVDATLCLGDHVSGPLDPAGAVDRLMQIGGPVIRGNHDRWLVEGERLDRVDRFASERLTNAHRQWLAEMPATAVFAGEVFLCHGTPQSDNAPWLDGWFDGRQATLPDQDAVAGLAEGYDYPLLLCGHTHMARSVRLRDGRVIVNPGAVGLQLVHGSPDARYAVVERRDGRWITELRVVEYDHHAAAALARANGFEAWSEPLATGWVGHQGLF